MRLPGIPEEVELVESFDQLREGLIVWCVPCTGCGGAYRSMLFNKKVGPVFEFATNTNRDNVHFWESLPFHTCSGMQHPWVISDAAIKRGRVYVVVDSMVKSSTTVARKKRPVKA